jgi:hypothetical protein
LAQLNFEHTPYTVLWVNNPIVDFECHNKKPVRGACPSPPAAALIVESTLLCTRSEDIYSQLARVLSVSIEQTNGLLNLNPQALVFGMQAYLAGPY